MEYLSKMWVKICKFKSDLLQFIGKWSVEFVKFYFFVNFVILPPTYIIFDLIGFNDGYVFIGFLMFSKESYISDISTVYSLILNNNHLFVLYKISLTFDNLSNFINSYFNSFALIDESVVYNKSMLNYDWFMQDSNIYAFYNEKIDYILSFCKFG